MQGLGDGLDQRALYLADINLIVQDAVEAVECVLRIVSLTEEPLCDEGVVGPVAQGVG